MKFDFKILFCLLIFSVNSAKCQLTFNRYFSDFGICAIRDVITVDSGYVIAGGNSNPNTSILIGLLDLEGNLVYYKNYGDSLSNWFHGLEGSLKKSSDGSFALAGSTNNSGLLFKFDHNLDTLWKKEYVFPTIALFYGCAQTISGYSMIGAIEDGNGFAQMILLKTDNLGSYLWERQYGGPYSEVGYKIINTDDGGFLLGGITYSYNSQVTVGNAGDWYLVKTDSMGFVQWQKHFGNPDWDDGRVGNMIQTQDTCYILSGAYITHSISTDEKYRRGRILKLDKDGNTIWDKLYGDEGIYTCT